MSKLVLSLGFGAACLLSSIGASARTVVFVQNGSDSFAAVLIRNNQEPELTLSEFKTRAVPRVVTTRGASGPAIFDSLVDDGVQRISTTDPNGSAPAGSAVFLGVGTTNANGTPGLAVGRVLSSSASIQERTDWFLAAKYFVSNTTFVQNLLWDGNNNTLDHTLSILWRDKGIITFDGLTTSDCLALGCSVSSDRGVNWCDCGKGKIVQCED